MSSAIVKQELSATEVERFSELEAVIQRGIVAFVEVGEALQEIREAKLWRGQYRTWEAYLKERWGFGRSRASQLIIGANFAKEVESVTGVTITHERESRRVRDALSEFPEVFHLTILAVASKRGKLTQSVIRRVGEVITQAAITGYVNTGDGDNSTPLEAALTLEDSEARKRQKQYISESTAIRPKLAEGRVEIAQIRGLRVTLGALEVNSKHLERLLDQKTAKRAVRVVIYAVPAPTDEQPTVIEGVAV